MPPLLTVPGFERVRLHVGNTQPWPCDTCAKREPGEPVAQWLCKPAPIVIQPNGEVVCHEWKPED